MGNERSGRKRTVCTHPRERGVQCVECRRDRQRRARERAKPEPATDFHGERVGMNCLDCDRPLREHGVFEFCRTLDVPTYQSPMRGREGRPDAT